MQLPKLPMRATGRLPKIAPQPQEPALETPPAACLLFCVAKGIWSRFANFQETATLWTCFPVCGLQMAVNYRQFQ